MGQTDSIQVADAYAVLGLKAGASRRELRRAYKSLVRKWHPDRYVADPVAQARATQKLAAINQAYRLLSRLRKEDAPPRPAKRPETSSAPAADRRTDEFFGRPLRPREKEAIIESIRRSQTWFPEEREDLAELWRDVRNEVLRPLGRWLRVTFRSLVGPAKRRP